MIQLYPIQAIDSRLYSLQHQDYHLLFPQEISTPDREILANPTLQIHLYSLYKLMLYDLMEQIPHTGAFKHNSSSIFTADQTLNSHLTLTLHSTWMAKLLLESMDALP